MDLDALDTTLGQVLARHTTLNLLAAPTVARYQLSARNLARFAAGEGADPSEVALKQLTPSLLLRFRAWSLERMRPISFNTERRHLSTLFNSAVRSGAIARNPFREVPGAPILKPLPRSLPKPAMLSYIELVASATKLDAQGRTVDLLPPQWFWLIVMRTLYLTGMRKRQLVGLRWRDVDFVGQTLCMSAATSKTRREWLIPLPEALVAQLAQLRDRTIQLRGPDIAGAQVFCLPLFSRWRHAFVRPEMSADNLDNFFQRLRRCAPEGLPRLSAHRIRHTTASILANHVPNLRLVQEQLGHASITTTFSYVHPDLKSMRKALEAL